jgi:hypothetical protein
MITQVYYRPSYLQGAYNPIVWSVASDKILEVDFKYVFDVYIDGVFVTRLKQRPNPSGAGMIDVSTLVQGYLKIGQPNGAWTQGETTIDTAQGFAYQDNGSLSIHVHLKVGEEYSDQGTLYIFNGITDNPGAPAYELWSGTSPVVGGSLPVHVWPSSVEYQLQQWGMSNAADYSGAYGKNPIDGRNYDWGLAVYAYSETGSPLSHQPLNSNDQVEFNAYTFDRMTLSWINWTPWANEGDLNFIYGFRYQVFDATGVKFTMNLPVYTDTGAGPRTTCDDIGQSSQLIPQYDILHTVASPEGVAQLLSYWGVGTWTPTAGDWIEIQGYNNANATPWTCAFNVPVTKKVKINVTEWCENSLYQRVRLSWLNDLGGRDYMNFTQFLEKSVNTTNDTYTQEQMDWSSTVPVPTGILDPSNYLFIQGGTKVYNKIATTSWTIQTDWLNQAEVDLLQGLQKSSQVLAYIHQEGSAFSDYSPFPVTITNSSYRVKNVRQNKLTQAEFTISLNIPQKLQNN